MSTIHENPGHMLTNTYILHDFAEIAYIVCEGTAPVPSANDGRIYDANSRQHVLTRLKNAEQQFRQAAILVILDAEKLQLFTFYKKVDIVKDQKAVLTKFGQVCKSNHCIIAHKNACRVLDLLKPDMARIHELFTAAIISNLRLQAATGCKVMKCGSRMFNIQSQKLQQTDSDFVPRTHAKWHIIQADLQVVPSGQLLLALRNARWPPLTAMTDLIDPDTSDLYRANGSTLYLVPTGQLARFKGDWTTAMTHEQEEHYLMRQRGPELQYRFRWISKARDWLNCQHPNLSIDLEPGTIWLAVEVPALARLDDDVVGGGRKLVWKTIYWPAALTFAFLLSGTLEVNDRSFPEQLDPLKVAGEWYARGVSDARNWSTESRIPDETEHAQDHLFDEDVLTDSPQQFMSLPMQAFTNGQTVYPTPPEALNAQTTPSVLLDAQTPATSHPTHAMYQSSPLATMTDAGSLPVQQPAIANFLSTDENEDLFEDSDNDEVLDHKFIADEPNWDFFNLCSWERRSEAPGSRQFGGV